MNYTRRMVNIIQASDVKTAYHVSWRDCAAKRKKRKAIKASRKRNRA